MNSPLSIAIMITLVIGLLFYAFMVPRSSYDYRIGGDIEDDPDGESQDNRWKKILGTTSAEIFSTLPAGVVSKVQGKPNSEIEILIRKSGNPWNIKANEYKPVQFILALLGAIVLSLIGFLFSKMGVLSLPFYIYIAAGGILGYIWPGSVYRTAAATREMDFKRQLPDALDLIIISLSSGTTFGTALREALPNMRPGVLREEFKNVSRRLDSGRTLHEALEGFIEKSPSEGITLFIRSVQEATELNVPLIDVMDARAKASREEYFALLQQKTASLESRMMAVLTPTLVPALLVTVMAPAISKLMQTM